MVGSQSREYGLAQVTVDRAEASLFAGLASPLDVWMSHGDRIEALPEGFVPLAHSENSPIAAMADQARRLYGLQFHPEVAHTPRGLQIIRNFVVDICGCTPD